LDTQVTLYVKPKNIYIFDKSGKFVSPLPERGR